MDNSNFDFTDNTNGASGIAGTSGAAGNGRVSRGAAHPDTEASLTATSYSFYKDTDANASSGSVSGNGYGSFGNPDGYKMQQWYRDYVRQQETVRRSGKRTYLYLNCSRTKDAGSTSKLDYYTTPLQEQFEALNARLRMTFTTLQQFMLALFPFTMDRTYYISMPALDRAESAQAAQAGTSTRVRNVVIRIDSSAPGMSFIPSRYNIIVIGDVAFGATGIYSFEVKGFDVIDAGTVKTGEAEITCRAACAFQTKEIRNKNTGSVNTVPDYDSPYNPSGMRNSRVDIKSPALTPDFINGLSLHCFPVRDKDAALAELDEWSEYVNFRLAYLSKISDRKMAADRIELRNAYSISKEAFGASPDTYAGHLLDGQPWDSEGDQVVLDDSFGFAESLPLIRVDIERNRKEILSDAGKKGPRFESELASWSRQPLQLSNVEPKYNDKDGSIMNISVLRTYALGDCFRIIPQDIEPDLSELVSARDREVASGCLEVDEHYDSIISAQENAAVTAEESRRRSVNSAKTEAYRQGLENSLPEDVAENRDEKIKSAYKTAVDAAYAKLCAPLKRTLADVNSALKSAESKHAKAQESKHASHAADASHDAGAANAADTGNSIKDTASTDTSAADAAYDANAAIAAAENEKENRYAAYREALEARKASLEEQMEQARADAAASVDLTQMYRERNDRLVKDMADSLEVDLQTYMKGFRTEQTELLTGQYKDERAAEKEKKTKAEDDRLKAESDKKIEEETIRCYHIYFSLADPTDMSRPDAVKTISESHFLSYDNRAEKAKLDRQKNALDSLRKGYVKNPYLVSYLFEPQNLPAKTAAYGANAGTRGANTGSYGANTGSNTGAYSVYTGANTGSDTDIKWFNQRLNEKQQEAVRLALSSDSLFLLQGPPGTGKTEVIAELAAQFAKSGRKVLISSETHKAVDNVFDRLPRIPEIRPLRLIPSYSAKTTEYSPDRLVDNFYRNIRETLDGRIQKLDTYEEDRDSFRENMKKLRLQYDRFLKLKQQCADMEKDIRDKTHRQNELIQKKDVKRDIVSSLGRDAEDCTIAVRCIDNCMFGLADGEAEPDGRAGRAVREYRDRLTALVRQYDTLSSVGPDKFSKLIKTDIDAIREDADRILSADDAELEREKERLGKIIRQSFDVMTGMLSDEGKQAQKKLIEITNMQNSASGAGIGREYSVIRDIAPEIMGSSEQIRQFPEDVSLFRMKQQETAGEITDRLNVEKTRILSRKDDAEKEIAALDREYNELGIQLAEIKEDWTEQEYRKQDGLLKRRILEFFDRHKINKEYPAGDYGAAINIIEDEWNRIEREYNEGSAAHIKRKDTYRHISEYLGRPDILEADREEFTEKLFKCANVFGITSTSRDSFTPRSLESLGRYGIKNVDVRKEGIDVVIVDEVSKSAFVDLLIPILYGKTVILVGDHRQLPPMYDLRFLKEKDFENFDESVITPERNREYQRMYESSFFRALYERVPAGYRVMLTKQYRCHPDIMEVFNIFYKGHSKDTKFGLEAGKTNQADEKAHNITVTINGRPVIEPDYHVYFIDCKGEEKVRPGSTSFYNELEAKVACRLLDGINDTVLDMIKAGRIKRNDADPAKDERPSVGVICTYKGQSRNIGRKRSSYDGFSNKPDEKFLASTVDDFQGDERDIIILSLVRSSASKDPNLEFIKRFERINVALSRARKLLIVLGSRNFLTADNVTTILPDPEGGYADEHFHIFREVIDVIGKRGRLLSAGDVLDAADTGTNAGASGFGASGTGTSGRRQDR